MGTSSVDYDALARTLVVDNARIREGDKVLITGGTRDLELLEDLAVQARSVGAHPLIVVDSERLTKRMFDDVPEKYDTQSPDLMMALADIIDAWIDVPISAPPDLLAHVAPARFVARGDAFEPVTLRLRERGVRFVELGNALYPTAWRAEQFAISEAELGDLFWGGIAVDYPALKATGEAIRAKLAAADEIHITHPNGTDLRVQIGGRPVHVSDGVISPEDEAAGGAATQVWLPAGEVYVTAVPGTASGTVRKERVFFQGKEIQNLVLTFTDGKLASMDAESGIEPLRTFYDAATGPKDVFSIVDIGINPNLTVPTGGDVESYSPAGTVTLVFGDNTWAGGDNQATFNYPVFLTGATLSADGVPIVEDGALVR